ncbi:MAG: HAD-IA family hydrolase [Nitriliruptorales bacterium]|nr:HAD-IA family hydrolase [Nitriliruptorales bacterium]
MTAPTPSVLLDLDGTLVDSVFLHVVTWHHALKDAGRGVPMWRIHEGIGMGGERLVPWLLGEHVDEADDLTDAHRKLFLERAEDLVPTPGAHALLADLRLREVPFIVATSAGGEIAEALLGALGNPEVDVFNADNVGSPKPAPDLLAAAMEKLGTAGDDVTLVGDSPWDAEAAQRLGVRMLAVRCGGFGDDRLLDAGAAAVVDDPRALVGRL